MTRLGVEKNNGGDFFSDLIANDLKAKGYYCNITTHNAPTNKKKLDRILACQNEIKGIAIEEHTYKIYFKSPDSIKGNTQYQEAMRQLYNWNQNKSAQNKQHDEKTNHPLSGMPRHQHGLCPGRSAADSTEGQQLLHDEVQRPHPTDVCQKDARE